MRKLLPHGKKNMQKQEMAVYLNAQSHNNRIYLVYKIPYSLLLSSVSDCSRSIIRIQLYYMYTKTEDSMFILRQALSAAGEVM
jgi:hypothetical protein